MSSEIRADLSTSQFIEGKNRTSVTSAVGRSTVFQFLPGIFSKAFYFYFCRKKKRRQTCEMISHAPSVIRTWQGRRRKLQQAAWVCLEGKAAKSGYEKSILISKPKATTFTTLRDTGTSSWHEIAKSSTQAACTQ